MAEDCQRVVSVKSDSKPIEESGVAHNNKNQELTNTLSPLEEKSKITRPNIYDRNKIRQTQSGDNEDMNLRKYVMFKIFNKTEKNPAWLGFRPLDNKFAYVAPSLLRTKTTACSVTGDSISILGEVVLIVPLNVITKKLKAYVPKNTDNLFGTDWIEKSNLWDCPMSTFCRKLESPVTNTEKLKQELKQKFP